MIKYVDNIRLICLKSGLTHSYLFELDHNKSKSIFIFYITKNRYNLYGGDIMSKKNIIRTVKEHCEPIIEDLGYELVDLEYIKENGR